MKDIVKAVSDQIKYRRKHNFYDGIQDDVLFSLNNLFQLDPDCINEHFNASPEYFHKGFRQSGVLCYSDKFKDDRQGGLIDSVIHSLLSISKLFWKINYKLLEQ